MKTEIIKSFTELLSVIESAKIGQNMIFRGISDSSYELITSLGRSESVTGKSTKKLEERLIKLFKESSIPYLEHQPQNELEWLAVAQHFGLPTRLLDWSYNPLISIYFAVESKPEQDSAVFMFSGCSTIQDSNQIDPYSLDKVCRYRPPHISSRIQNQAGLFTIHNEPNEPFEHDKLIKIIIPKAKKSIIKKTLFKYGINQRIIYPGLEGVSKDLKWLETKIY